VRIVLPTFEEPDRDRIERLVSRLIADVAGRLGTRAPASVTLRFHPSVASYQRSTGRAWWTAATAIGTRIDLLPVEVLERRQQLERTLRHELVHVITASELQAAPLWAREGLAHYMAGALGARPIAASTESEGTCPDDASFGAAGSAAALAELYDRAAACVARTFAEGRTWRAMH
jgi:hypothetical protein